MKKLNELQSYLTRLRGLMLTLIILCSIGVGNAWGAEETVTYTITSTTAVSTSGTTPAGSSASYSQKNEKKGQADKGETMTLTLTGFDGCTITGLSCEVGCYTGWFGYVSGTGTISIDINGDNKGSLTLNRPGAPSSKTVPVKSTTVAEDGTIVITISATESSLYCNSYTITYTAPACANTVTVAKTLAQTNGSISLSSTSVATCGDDASRQVTVTVDPVDCYIPQASEVTWTGTSVTKVSGPTLNGSGNYDYVFQFAQNATGTTTFDCSLATRETYTVSYDAGNTTCTGSNAITGSHVNDTKTCGTNLTLPGETFHTTGYTQTGWTKTPCGSQTNGLRGTYSSNAAQTFYPVWTANKYTVTWSVNGSTYTTTENVTYNTTTSTPANPSVPGECTGSTFMGWTKTQNYTGDNAPGDLFNGTTPAITGNVTFYAVFADEE